MCGAILKAADLKGSVTLWEFNDARRVIEVTEDDGEENTGARHFCQFDQWQVLEMRVNTDGFASSQYF